MINPCSPIKIGTKTLKNRITMAPTVKFYAGEDGFVTDEFVRHYELRAAHECALIVVEATAIAPAARLFPTQLGLWCDEQIEGHRRIADACHKHGAVVIPQISHAGVKTHPACGPMVGPSSITIDFGDRIGTVHELSVDEIHKIIDDFASAALRAKKAGYDGVQLHACHTYIINDFASAYNQRNDEYADKTRFGSEVIAAIRKACGPDFIIAPRVSGCDPTVEEAIEIAEAYVTAGADYIQVSNGVNSGEEITHDETLPYNKVAALGVIMRDHFNGRIPVSCVNGFRTVEQVRYMFEHDLIDTIDLACGLLADPCYTEAILHGTPYVKCFSCPDCAFGPMHKHPCPAAKLRGVDKSVRF